ncbi:MAG: DeoR family transcriptional regulator [Candidatus Dojkabacteria bacterium]
MSTLSVFLGALSLLLGFSLIYILIKSRSKDEKDMSSNNRLSVKNVDFKLHDRQSEILKLVRKKKELTPSEIYQSQPDVSTRTLRRDMNVLINAGLVRQEGNTKSTKYTYIG